MDVEITQYPQTYRSTISAGTSEIRGNIIVQCVLGLAGRRASEEESPCR
jgi:hypothetical protein